MKMDNDSLEITQVFCRGRMRRFNLAFHKFTLIELLICIAIIAVLVGMLLPVLNKARDKAASIKCLSNVNTQIKGIMQYASDYNDYVPKSVSPLVESSEHYGWRVVIAPYIGVQLPVPLLNSGGYYTGYVKGAVSVKGSVFYCDKNAVLKGLGSYGLSCSWGTDRGWGFTYRRLNHIKSKSPGDVIVSGDTSDAWEETMGTSGYYLYGDCVFGDEQKYIGYRHDRGINLSWADGHVSWMKTSEIQRRGAYYFKLTP